MARFVIVLLVGIVYAPLCRAQTSGSAVGKGSVSCFRIFEHVLGNKISFEICDRDLDSSPAWLRPETKPAPLSIRKAVALAKRELGKYAGEPSKWKLDRIEMFSLGEHSKWFYEVEWRPTWAGYVGDGIGIPVLMTGDVIKGSVEPDDGFGVVTSDNP